jgi:hypothetical protein
MNKQEIFDTVVKGILAQGGESFDHKKGFCVYKNSNGRKCAIGQLISEEKYNPEVETLRLNSVLKLIDSKYTEEFLFFDKLQHIHDVSGRSSRSDRRVSDEIFLWTWKTKMIEFAKQENLSIEVFGNAD